METTILGLGSKLLLQQQGVGGGVYKVWRATVSDAENW